MRRFLLLGDITGSLVVLGLVVAAFGGLAVFRGIQLQRTSATATGNNGIGCVAVVFGILVVLIALAFLSDVWSAS